MVELSPIALLESSHDRRTFDCGIEPLNIYLKQYALQNQKKGTVRNYVTCRGIRVAGYFSLPYGSAVQTDAPPALTKGLGKYPVPVMMLARLAVDLREKGQGLGKALLKNAVLVPCKRPKSRGSRPFSCKPRTTAPVSFMKSTDSAGRHTTRCTCFSRWIRCANERPSWRGHPAERE